MFADGLRVRHDVDVMKAEVGQSQSGEELEGLVQLVIRRRLIDRTAVPGPPEGAGAEHVEAIPVEGVPVAHGHAQVLLHGLSQDHAVLVVVTEGEGILRIRTLIGNGGDVAEV